MTPLSAVDGAHDREARLRRAFVGSSPPAIEVRRQIQQAAACDATVLLTGETGVGKELAASWIHALSARAASPFVTIHCAGVADSLLESELFGHRRGSFTDAERDRCGKLVLADSGTVFLDEVAAMSARLQGALLRWLENGEVQPVGAGGSHRVDVRVVAATNGNLRELVAAGSFREDLFYRLDVVHIHLPPLRERREDIPVLADFFLAACRKAGDGVPPLSPAAIASLQELDWAGNVRQLESVVRRMAVSGWSDHLIGYKREPAVGPPSPPIIGERRRTVADRLYDDLIRNGHSFWTAVYTPFMEREITRDDLRSVIGRGLVAARGNYRILARLFNIPPHQYKKLLDFLRRYDCCLPYGDYR